MVIETCSFRLADGVADSTFLEQDRRWQTELVPNRTGFVRRTTAGRDGRWLVVTLWASEEDADAFSRETAGHEVRGAFEDQLAPESVLAARYDTLD